MVKETIVAGILCCQALCFAQNRQPANIAPPPREAVFSEGSFEAGMKTWTFWQFAPSLGGFELSANNPRSGARCAKMTILNRAQEIWHVQLQQKNFPVRKNVMYRLTYWARGENGAGVLEAVFVKGSPPWTFYSAKKDRVTREWKQYEMLFTSPLTTTDIQLAFQCAHHTGEYYIDDIAWEEAGELQLRDVGAAWYANAEARIDSIRKAGFSIRVIDEKGGPWRGTVEVKLLRHAFHWGTCLAFRGGEDEKRYRKTALNYFNAGVFENAFKWEEYEKTQGKPDIAGLEEYLRWSEKNEVPIRGHALLWGIELFGYDKHWARLQDDAFLRQAIKDRITRDVTKYKNRIAEYDVWNEPVHEPALFFRLGRDILDSAFVWAHRADPGARLFINEYSIISGSDAKLYRDLIERLIKNGTPVHGIGVQGHFSGPIEPADVAAKLYYMGELGLPIKVTEFDLDVKALGLSDAEMAAEYAKLLRCAFSHPAVEGFYFWGFWDARHWRPGAGLFDYDFTPKPAADSVYNLIHNVWTTRDTIQTTPDGEARFRGFFGRYEVTVKDGKKSRKRVIVDFPRKGAREKTVDLRKK